MAHRAASLTAGLRFSEEHRGHRWCRGTHRVLAAIARARKAGSGAHTRLLTTTRLVVHRARLWLRGSRLLPSPMVGVSLWLRVFALPQSWSPTS